MTEGERGGFFAEAVVDVEEVEEELGLDRPRLQKADEKEAGEEGELDDGADEVDGAGEGAAASNALFNVMVKSSDDCLIFQQYSARAKKVF